MTAYDFLFVFNGNHSSTSLRFRYNDDKIFVEVKAVSATSGGHRVTLTGGFDFLVFYSNHVPKTQGHGTDGRLRQHRLTWRGHIHMHFYTAIMT